MKRILASKTYQIPLQRVLASQSPFRIGTGRQIAVARPAMSTKTSRTYVLPNTKIENDRLDYQHEILTRTFGGLHRAPLEPRNIRRVLDIGCGTCNWAIDFAKQYPRAQVVGVDIEEKPGRKIGPENFVLRMADLEQEETWNDIGTFDYIHARFLAVVVRDWPKMLSRCLEHLSPGGWLELQDLYLPVQCLDSEDTARSKFVEWSDLMIEASSKLGIRTETAGIFPRIFQEAGYTAVQAEDFKKYSGPWNVDSLEAQELGRMGQNSLCTGLPGFSETLFTSQLGWTSKRHAEYVSEIIQEMRQVKYRTWVPVKVRSKIFRIPDGYSMLALYCVSSLKTDSDESVRTSEIPADLHPCYLQICFGQRPT